MQFLVFLSATGLKLWKTQKFFKMDGWMTGKFTSFSTVFQSYQDNEQLIMKGCVQWNPIDKISPRVGLELGTARSVGQCLTHRATGAP